jgi:hypothetical protein
MLGPSDHLAAPLEITHVLPLAPPSPCAPRYEVWRRRVLGGPRVGRRLRAFIASTVVPVALALWFAHVGGGPARRTRGGRLGAWQSSAARRRLCGQPCRCFCAGS